MRAYRLKNDKTENISFEKVFLIYFFFQNVTRVEEISYIITLYKNITDVKVSNELCESTYVVLE